MKVSVCLLFALLSSTFCLAQNEGVSIRSNGGAPHSSAMLDVVHPQKGVLLPRVNLVTTTNSTTPVNGPADGLLLFNLTTTVSTGRGYYYWDQPTSAWTRLNTGPQFWAQIASSNHIHYTSGNVRIGTSSTVSPTYNLEVINTAASNSYIARFAGPQGDVKIGYVDPVSQPSVGYASYLTQTSGSYSSGGTNYYSMIFSQVHGDGFKGLELISWLRPAANSTLNWANINANKNKLFIMSDSEVRICAGQPTGNTVIFDGINNWGSSDSTLKKNITTMSSVISNLMQLRPVTYKWKNDPAGKLQDGLIAQEVEVYFPRLVTTKEFPANNAYPYLDNVSKKMLNLDGLVPILVKAIQEQQTKIEELESRIYSLEHP